MPESTFWCTVAALTICHAFLWFCLDLNYKLYFILFATFQTSKKIILGLLLMGNWISFFFCRKGLFWVSIICSVKIILRLCQGDETPAPSPSFVNLNWGWNGSKKTAAHYHFSLNNTSWKSGDKTWLTSSTSQVVRKQRPEFKDV